MKFRPVGAELLHAHGRIDRHDEANGWLFPILVTRLIITALELYITDCYKIKRTSRKIRYRYKFFYIDAYLSVG
jgi:hypothetical protein